MKIVALDVGGKRIGVATADTAVKIAVPYVTVEVDGREYEQVAEIMRENGARHLVVGLPRNSKGEETAQTKTVRDFVAGLLKYFDGEKMARPLVKFQDESLTSVMAEERMARQDSRKKKRRGRRTDVDQEAAVIILQDFLDGFSGKGEDLDKENPDDIWNAKKKPKKVRGRGWWVLATVLALLVVAVIGGVTWYNSMLKAMGCVKTECAEKTFVVGSGDSSSDIADRLESEKLIQSALAMKIYLRINPEAGGIKAGSYQLNGGMSVEEILRKLKEGSAAATFRMTFYPGETVADARKHLMGAGYRAEEVDAALTKNYDHALFAGKPADGNLEGYIYGETLEFYSTATVEDILVRYFDEMYKVIEQNDLVEKYRARGFSLYEGVKLASVIQREVSRYEDQQGAAQVFELRLARGIPLGSDAVIGYRADIMNPGRDKTDMSYLNLSVIPCPWNSRHCAGLPPGPISSPGAGALRSVGEPAAGDYLYFLTGDDGKMYYARTEAEHEKNRQQYCKKACLLI